MKRLMLIPAFIMLSGCATMVSGTTQNIAFSVTPSNAQCELTNTKGDKLAIVTAQNNIVHVAKSSSDMILSCMAKGFTSKSTTIVSKVNPGAAMIMGLGDIGSGAIYKYPEHVSVRLEQ